MVITILLMLVSQTFVVDFTDSYQVVPRSISSSITLNQLREYEELFEKLVNCQPKLDLNTVWCGNQFDGDLQIDASNVFVDNQASSRLSFPLLTRET